MSGDRVRVLASLVMVLGVAAGAYGAHGLAARVGAERVEVWETAVLYHLVHGLALFVAAGRGRAGRLATAGFCGGLLLFCGSLYALVLFDQAGFGAVTPFGGVSFLAGWIALAVSHWRRGRTTA